MIEILISLYLFIGVIVTCYLQVTLGDPSDTKLGKLCWYTFATLTWPMYILGSIIQFFLINAYKR